MHALTRRTLLLLLCHSSLSLLVEPQAPTQKSASSNLMQLDPWGLVIAAVEEMKSRGIVVSDACETRFGQTYVVRVV